MSTAYEIVTESIIKQLESGVAPWRKPWRTETPANLVSKKEYRGINVFLLASQGYGSRYWLTYRQAQALGGNVKKGEHGSKVVFWKIDEYQKENQETGETENHKSILLRYYTVFNVEQCEGIKSPDPARSSIPLSNAKALSNPCHIHQLRARCTGVLPAFNRYSRHAGTVRIPFRRGILLDAVSRTHPFNRSSFSRRPRRDHETQPIRQ